MGPFQRPQSVVGGTLRVGPPAVDENAVARVQEVALPVIKEAPGALGHDEEQEREQPLSAAGMGLYGAELSHLLQVQQIGSGEAGGGVYDAAGFYGNTLKQRFHGMFSCFAWLNNNLYVFCHIQNQELSQCFLGQHYIMSTATLMVMAIRPLHDSNKDIVS